MRKIILLISLSIVLGIMFTFFVLNNENAYAKEEYMVYAFQVGAYEKEENAKEYSKKLPSSIIIREDNLYKIYVTICKDIDIINKMVVYFENMGINIYLKGLKINKNFKKILENYEELIKNSDEEKVYDKVNQSILNDYIESINYE